MILGLDISTSVIGAAVLHNDGTFKRAAYCDFKDIERRAKKLDFSSYDVLFEKIDKAKDFIVHELRHEREAGVFGFQSCDQVWHEGSGLSIFIEDRLGGFSHGHTQMQTLMKLGAFNLVVSWIAFEEASNMTSVSVRHIHPSTVKAIMRKQGLEIPKGADKKELTLSFVSKKLGSAFPVERTKTGKPKPHMYDQADAYITACAGLEKFKSSKED